MGGGVGCRTCRTPTVTFLSSSWQINPGLEILVQQSRVRPRRGGATLQRQSLGKMKNKYGFLQGTKFVTGSCLCHGRGRSPPAGSWGLSIQGHGRRGGEGLLSLLALVTRQSRASSQLPTSLHCQSLWMKDLGCLCCTFSLQSLLQLWLCHLPQQDSPEPGTL